MQKLVDFKNECLDSFKDGGSLLRRRSCHEQKAINHDKVVDLTKDDKD